MNKGRSRRDVTGLAESAVRILLDADEDLMSFDPDDPSENIERFAKAIGAENAAKDKTVLTKFKRAVRGYIKWAHTDEEQGNLYDADDLAALRKAKTFAEAEAILARYENEPSFLYMVRSGYFV